VGREERFSRKNKTSGSLSEKKNNPRRLRVRTKRGGLHSGAYRRIKNQPAVGKRKKGGARPKSAVWLGTEGEKEKGVPVKTNR